MILTIKFEGYYNEISTDKKRHNTSKTTDKPRFSRYNKTETTFKIENEIFQREKESNNGNRTKDETDYSHNVGGEKITNTNRDLPTGIELNVGRT